MPNKFPVKFNYDGLCFEFTHNHNQGLVTRHALKLMEFTFKIPLKNVQGNQIMRYLLNANDRDLCLFRTCASFVETGKLSNRLILGYTFGNFDSIAASNNDGSFVWCPCSFQLIELIELYFEWFCRPKKGIQRTKCIKVNWIFRFIQFHHW